MRFFERLTTLTNTRAAAALAALLVSAAPVAAQTTIDVTPETATVRAGKWVVTSDSTASGGAMTMRHPDGGVAKLTTALASPANYFEVTFSATAGVPYKLEMLGKADNNSWANDSVFVQFADSVTASGSATWRIGTASATEVNLEDCSGCGISGWKWQDNAYGVSAPFVPVYFAATGTQKLRVQTREDGMSIDQIRLTPQGAAVPPPPPPPDQPSTLGTTIKVLDWNTHHGIGTDGVFSLDRFIPYIVKSGANVVSLNEVEKNVGGSYGNVDAPAKYASLLKAATGKTWYYKFAQRDGNTNGQGNLILTTFQIEDSDDYQLSYSRSVARVQILVGGIRVNVFSTHLDADSSARRTTEMNELKSWASSFPEQRILCGDFNAWPGAGEIANMTSAYTDTWAAAKTAGTSVAYDGNEAGNTRNSRIDYVWLSKGSSRTTIKASQVFDVRNSSGVAPSDHRPVMTTLLVK
jgi:endonuclease/exonuclease/phosphatase family metal-dependent hydrolase